MTRKQLWRALSLTVAASLAIAVAAAPVSAKGRNTSKSILIGSSDGSGGVQDPGPNGDGHATLSFTPVTAGGLTFFDVVVMNDGGQNINDVSLSVGYDSDTRDESARPVTVDLTPTFPVAFPADSGLTVLTFAPMGDTCTLGAADVGPISCNVGTLRKGQSFKLQVVLSAATPGAIPVKAVTKVSENTNDNGGNQDTFAAEGALTVVNGGCDLVSTYLLPYNANPVDTCQEISGSNPQSTKVEFVNGATPTAITVGESAEDCPIAGATCIGDASTADIAIPFTGAVKWTIQVDVTGLNLNLNKLMVYHFKDGATTPDLVLDTKHKSLCKSDTDTGCLYGEPTITTVGGYDILTVVVVTKGNGKIRFL